MFEVGIIYKDSNLDRLSKGNLWESTSEIEELNNFFSISHNKHKESLETLCQILHEQGIKYTLLSRNTPDVFRISKKFHLWISFGGDGTFLYCSHYVKDTPILGINSSPSTSVGHYCKFNMFYHQKEFINFLKNLNLNNIKHKKIERLDIHINGTSIGMPVLNDLLIAASNPAETSFYLLEYKNKVQRQRSSGLWIATSTGATAAFKSAGGKVFNAVNRKKERQFGVIVRELYSTSESKKLVQMHVSENEKFSISSGMSHGAIFVDGFHNKFNFLSGDRLEIKFYKDPLITY